MPPKGIIAFHSAHIVRGGRVGGKMNKDKRDLFIFTLPKLKCKINFKNFTSTEEKLKKIKTIKIWGSSCAFITKESQKASSFCIRGESQSYLHKHARNKNG